MPDTCLQKDNFPAHILWNKNINLEILLKIPNSILIKEIYNVSKGGIKELSKGVIKINKYDVNGYVGFVFHSKLLKKPKVIENIEFEIIDPITNESEKFIKNIELFRPYLNLEKSPDKIFVKGDTSLNKVQLSEKIKLKNIGDGTALILIDTKSDDHFLLSLPTGYDSFTKRFLIDMERKMETLKEKFPNYSDTIDSYIDLLKHSIAPDEKYIKKIKKVSSDLLEKFENDKDFQNEITSTAFLCYIENIELITELRSFLEYLNSIGTGRIILLNSIFVIKSSTPSGRFNLQIQSMDLAYNVYPQIQIPEIEIICDKDCEIPIHSLFEWN